MLANCGAEVSNSKIEEGEEGASKARGTNEVGSSVVVAMEISVVVPESGEVFGALSTDGAVIKVEIEPSPSLFAVFSLA
ncbi:hypothetical protein HK098_001788 [Nowakowskiella sp. JEL0407]|nr:hypothetical protein HK098_001788 [Nowakowskiella sp. JEL0407]